jgi:uncharacterized membrane protein
MGLGDDLFGGIFDFNGDGHTDFTEEYLAYKMFEELNKEESNDEFDDLDNIGIFNNDVGPDNNFDDLDDIPIDYEAVYNYQNHIADEEITSDDTDNKKVAEKLANTLSAVKETKSEEVKEEPKSDDESESNKEDKDTKIKEESQTKSTLYYIPPTLNFDEYKKRRRKFIWNCLVTIFVTMLLGFFPCAFIWASFSSYDENNQASGFVIFVVVAVALFFLGIIFKVAYEGFSKDLTQIRAEKEVYLKTATDEELKSQNKHKIIAGITVAIIFTIITGLLIGISVKKEMDLSSAYNKAVELAFDSKYEEAKEVLKSIEDKDYKDSKALKAYCDARLDYEANFISSAYYDFNDAEFYHQTAEHKKIIDDFKETLEKEYDKFLSEKLEKEQAEYERQKRLEQQKKYEEYKASQYTTKYKYKSYKPKKSYNDLDVSDFNHPEDFYDWYYDDFFDYEDAEDYYYSHGGK